MAMMCKFRFIQSQVKVKVTHSNFEFDTRLEDQRPNF